MSDVYVDNAGADTADATRGDSWANAFLTLSAAIVRTGGGNSATAAAAGDRYFLKGSGGYLEDNAGVWTLTFSGTVGNPDLIFACKDATTNEPPVNSDLVADKDDAEVALLSTGVASGVYAQTFGGSFHSRGVELHAGSSMIMSPDGTIIIEEGNLSWGQYASGGQDLSIGSGSAPRHTRVTLINCDIPWNGLGNQITTERGGDFIWLGGSLTIGTTSGTTTGLVGGIGRAILRGVDLTILGTGEDFFVTSSGEVDAYLDGSVEQCKIGANFSLSDGLPDFDGITFRSVGCLNDTGLGANEAVQQFEIQTYRGTLTNSTKARTGGADDGASGTPGGGWSCAMDVRANGTLENVVGLETDEIPLWVAGDGTSKTLTAYLVREGAASAPAALQDDEVYLRVRLPSDAAATDESMYSLVDTRPGPLATPANLTTDTSTYTGTSANQTKQKIEQAISPDYEGPVFVTIIYAKRIASPGVDDTLYADLMITVT